MTKLDYFKLELLKILEEQERLERNISKALDYQEYLDSCKKTIGSIEKSIKTFSVWHTKNGDIPMKRISPGKWVRVINNVKEKISYIKIKKEIWKCKNSQELLNLALKYKELFTNNKDRITSIIDNLSKEINKKNDILETKNNSRELNLLEYEKKFPNYGGLLIDNLKRILNGDKSLVKKYFIIAYTDEKLKQYGIKGNIFTIKYGVITHHKNKDDDHRLSVSEWKQICKNINNPRIIAKYVNPNATKVNKKYDQYRLYVDVIINNKTAVIGVDVYDSGFKGIYNIVSTSFARNEPDANEIIVYKR